MTLMRRYKSYIAGLVACLLLLACSWRVLAVHDSYVSPDKSVIAYNLYMGAGGAAGVTETWVILSDENMNLKPNYMPSNYKRVGQFSYGCLEINWTDDKSLELLQCSSRIVKDGTKQVEFNDRKYNITVKTALNCQPDRFYETTRRIGTKAYCDNLDYAG